MSNAPNNPFSVYLDSYQRKIEDQKHSEEQQRVQEIHADIFRQMWDGAYHDRNIASITGLLLALVDRIEQRFWDFELARLIIPVGHPSFNVSHNLAVVALICACKRDSAAIRDGMSKAMQLPLDIHARHSNIYIRLSSLKRPPSTPPVTETQLATVLGTTRTVINNQWRQKKWECFGPKGKRRWNHIDPQRQREVLQEFRNFFPSKPWLEMRSDDMPNA